MYYAYDIKLKMEEEKRKKKHKDYLAEVKIYDKDFTIVDKRCKIDLEEVRKLLNKYEGEKENE